MKQLAKTSCFLFAILKLSTGMELSNPVFSNTSLLCPLQKQKRLLLFIFLMSSITQKITSQKCYK